MLAGNKRGQLPSCCPPGTRLGSKAWPVPCPGASHAPSQLGELRPGSGPELCPPDPDFRSLRFLWGSWCCWPGFWVCSCRVPRTHLGFVERTFMTQGPEPLLAAAPTWEDLPTLLTFSGGLAYIPEGTHVYGVRHATRGPLQSAPTSTSSPFPHPSVSLCSPRAPGLLTSTRGGAASAPCRGLSGCSSLLCCTPHSVPRWAVRPKFGSLQVWGFHAWCCQGRLRRGRLWLHAPTLLAEPGGLLAPGEGTWRA